MVCCKTGSILLSVVGNSEGGINLKNKPYFNLISWINDDTYLWFQKWGDFSATLKRQSLKMNLMGQEVCCDGPVP